VTRDDVISHDEARELLPWLVNDSLAEAEHDRVREHATNCVICRQELVELDRLRESVARTAKPAAMPAPDMRRINARIDALVEKEHRGQRLLEALAEFLSSPWRVSFAPQTLLLVVLITVLLRPAPDPVEFTTLTTPEALPSGDYVRIVFDPDLEASDVAAILESAGLAIVSGPSERGVALLRFEASWDSEKRDETLRRLLGSPGVLFVAAATGESG
jgi:anti-sigma factor RsiW